MSLKALSTKKLVDNSLNTLKDSKMKYILVLLLSFNLFANYQYFYYDKKKITVNKDSYERYIKPQLKNIKTEYYFLAKKLNPLQNTIIKLRESVQTFIGQYNRKFKDCIIQQKEQSYCEVDVSSLLDVAYDIDRNIMALRKESLLPENFNAENISNYFVFEKHLDDLEILNSTIQRYLELRNIISGTVYTTYTTHFTDLSNTVIRLNHTMNFVFIDQLPDEERETFEALLIHFIAPLEENMIDNFEPSWFVLELGSLNLSWNTFHMNLEKGSKTFPESLVNLVKIMHNRWNAVLKTIF